MYADVDLYYGSSKRRKIDWTKPTTVQKLIKDGIDWEDGMLDFKDHLDVSENPNYKRAFLASRR